MTAMNSHDSRKNASKARDMLSDTEVSAFCAQLSMLLADGMILEEITAQLAALPDKSAPALTAAYSAVNAGVGEGMTLADACRAAGMFPGYMLSVTEISERCGRLAASLSSLAQYYESSARTSAHIRGAVIYPLGLFSMLSVVMWVMALCVFPMLSSVLSSLGANMGIADRLTAPIAAGRALGIVAASLLTLCALSLIFALILLASDSGRHMLGKILAGLGAFRAIRQDSDCGTFAHSLSLLMASGCPAPDAFGVIAKAFDTSPDTVSLALECRSRCDEGESPAAVLISKGIFAGADAHMLLTAEKSGDMSETLAKLAIRRQRRAEERTDSAVAAAEPITAAAVSAAMGLILLSILLPAAAVMNVIG
ncbi:MAG: type II secretion system F family protein [Eubacteriales bacterium]